MNLNFKHSGNLFFRCKRRSSVNNPHLDEMKEDVLYHLGLTKLNDDLRIMFGDVKVSA